MRSLAVIAVGLCASAAHGAELSAVLRFDASDALAMSMQEQPTDAEQTLQAESELIFGEPDPAQWWWTIGGGWSHVPNTSEDYAQFFVSASTFVARDFEVILEGGVWSLDQDGPDAEGISALLDFRWHFLTDDTARRDWTIFGELGIGAVLLNDNAPENGSHFNFLPRAGLGVTRRLGQGDNRLLLGVRWQHLSNGRIKGGDNNPGRDGVMLYAGVMIPF